MELNERRYDIDWLRIIAFYILILFHAGMFFVPWNFHFKNPVTTEWFETWMAFLSQWRLPLLFMISGIGVSYALQKRSASRFLGERSRRLLIPIIFGMIVIVPPQIYFERLSQGVQYSSYFDFWKTVFEFISYPKGNMSWHHLWFVVYIFVYSIIALPIFLFFRSRYSTGIKIKLSSIIENRPSIIYIIWIPLALVYFILAPIFPTTHNLIHDWYNLTYSLIFFVTGYLITTIEKVWDVIVAQRKKSLIIATIPSIFLIMFVWGPTFYIMNEETEFFRILYGILKITLVTFLLYAILGYGKVLLNKPGKVLSYLNESVYPLYILHQSVQLTIGYYILKLDWGSIPKFMLVIVGTFSISFIIYELLIRRFNLMRLFFGLKIKPAVKKEMTHDELKVKKLIYEEVN